MKVIKTKRACAFFAIKAVVSRLGSRQTVIHVAQLGLRYGGRTPL